MADPSLDDVFLRRRPSLLRRLARLVGCHAAAEDLVQETWIRSSLAGSVARPAAFLERVALNLSRDHLYGVALRGAAGAAALDGLACPQPDPEWTLLHRERLRRAEAALAGLPPRRREVFLAGRLDGLPHAEIAARYGITPAAVEKHVARAMLALATAMSDEG